MYHPGERLSVNSHRHRKASPRQSCTQCHGSPKRSIYSPKHRGLGKPRDPFAQGIQVIQPELLIKPRTEALV